MTGARGGEDGAVLISAPSGANAAQIAELSCESSVDVDSSFAFGMDARATQWRGMFTGQDLVDAITERGIKCRRRLGQLVVAGDERLINVRQIGVDGALEGAYADDDQGARVI